MDQKYITLDCGTQVPVSDEVYNEYYRFKWREEKATLRRSKKEQSYDAMCEFGAEISIIHNQKLTDEIVEDKLLLETLISALDTLTAEERAIVDDIYFKCKTEREIEKSTGIPRKTIAYRRDKILEKIRKLLKI